MNRHPEAKSLEEALEVEKEHFCCMAYHIKWQVLFNDYGALHFINKKDLQILGTSITLEDIMLILPKNFAFWNLHNSFVKIDAHNSYQPVTGYNTHWQLTKSLHEQTPETWEKIANLID